MGSSSTNYPITGIQEGLDPNTSNPLREVPVRMEIDDWFTSTDPIHLNQQALFFPAFLKFADKDPHDPLSYYQIAGIHGQPYVAWPIEPPTEAKTRGEGYCTHGSILFTTWHRPYMLLWEQAIYELMKEEIQRFPPSDQHALHEALASWRFPYWDWAMKKARNPDNENDLTYDVPLVLKQEEVEIRVPPPQMTRKIRNALHHFQMPQGMIMGDEKLISKDKSPEGRRLKDLRVHAMGNESFKVVYNLCQATSRRLTAGDATAKTWATVQGQQNNEAIATILNDQTAVTIPSDTDQSGPQRRGNVTASLREAFYRLFTIKSFEDFATKRTITGNEPLPNDSAEGLHDSLHSWCGGGTIRVGNDNTFLNGQMSDPAVAAFDPIFWLHHCNIDRLFAMWQILHDDDKGNTWFDGSDPRDKDEGNFAIPRQQIDKPDSPLKPFLKSTGEEDYYTSNDIRDVTPLGYTYPGLEKWNYTDQDGKYNKERHVKDLNILLNNAYGSGRRAVQKARLTASPGQPGLQLNAITRDDVPEEDQIGVPDYVVDVIYEKFALDGVPFSIHIFVGKPGEAPYLFTGEDPPVGEIVNFSSPKELEGETSGCGNCRSQAADHTKSTGRVVLTNALITRWKNRIPHTPDDPNAPKVLQSMKPEDVVEFLKHNLHWRVTSLGRPVDLGRIPSLKVALGVGKADHFVDKAKLSQYYGYKGAHQVTQGRPGGAGPEDGLYPPGYEWR
ncbi:di-copper centre-containing protein [Fusarium bulbicola]|nr:di-copper centre-containing protein [Fusarium bulbicola]